VCDLSPNLWYSLWSLVTYLKRLWSPQGVMAVGFRDYGVPTRLLWSCDSLYCQNIIRVMILMRVSCKGVTKQLHVLL
jgi:hypothetical protein